MLRLMLVLRVLVSVSSIMNCTVDHPYLCLLLVQQQRQRRLRLVFYRDVATTAALELLLLLLLLRLLLLRLLLLRLLPASFEVASG